MSQEFEKWCKDMIQKCIRECVRPSSQKSIHVMMNDPYGLCLNWYKTEKGHPASVEYRQYLLNEMHNEAERLLSKNILKDPEEIKRCQEFIKKTVFDHRALKKKDCKRDNTVQIFEDSDWV